MMAGKTELKQWVVDAIEARGGESTLLDVAKYIWENHEQDLRASGDLFYKWQYDMRWAATSLRREGKMTSEWALKK